MMLYRKITVLLLVLLMGLLSLTACSGAGTTVPDGSAAPGPVSGKYDPPIDVVSVKAVDATFKFHEGDDIYDNVWTRAYRDKLGINLSYMWVVDGAQRQQKLSATIMSGEIPDIFTCDSQMFKLLYDSGSIADLTDLYDREASANTKDIIAEDPLSLRCAAIDGKIMGIPITDSSVAGAPVLWVRQDWLQALGMEGPRTMDDVLAIARRFTTDDPDRNGQDDTVGLALSKELWGTFAGIKGFFDGYHAYPGIWMDRGSSLVYGSVQPEMKDALAALQSMYAEGLLDREFGVKDSNKVAETIANGQAGMEFGVWWNPYHPLNLSQANNPDAYWQAYPIPSSDGEPAYSQYGAAVNGFMVVNSNFEHPEALLKMVNFWCDEIVRNQDQEVRNEYLGNLDDPDIVLYKYTDFLLWEANAQMNTGSKIRDAVARRDPSGLNIDEFWRYQIIVAYFDQGIKEAWVEVATNGDNGSVQILGDIAAGQGMVNAFYGAPTPVMAEKMAALRTMEDEMITKIIMGDPLDGFDQFVDDWNRLGGADITAEVNAWRQNHS